MKYKLTVCVRGDSRLELVAALHKIAEEVRMGERPPATKNAWRIDEAHDPATCPNCHDHDCKFAVEKK